MGNEISHRRYCCKKFRRFRRLPAEEETAPDVPDVPTAQPAQGGGSRGKVSPPKNEKPQGAAAGLQGGEQGRKREMASCSPPVAQGTGRSSELQPGEAGDRPPAINPAGKTRAPTQGRAEAAGGHTEGTRRDSPGQPGAEVGAGKVQREQRAMKLSELYQVPNTRNCAFCKWMEKLKTPEEKPKAKPGAASSQE